MTNFAESFANTSDQALLHVLEFSDQYVPEALEAAKAELERRELSAAQMATAKEAAHNYEANKTNKLARTQEQIERSNQKAKTFWEKISPWKPGLSSAEQKFKLILLLWAILTANSIYLFFASLQYYNFSHFDNYALVGILSSIINTIIPIVCFFWLFKVQKKGWITLAGLLYLNLIFGFLALINLLRYSFEFDSDPIMGVFAPTTTQVARDLFFLAYNILLLYLLMDTVVRDFFAIKKKDFINSIWVSLLLLGITSLPMLFYIFE